MQSDKSNIAYSVNQLIQQHKNDIDRVVVENGNGAVVWISICSNNDTSDIYHMLWLIL